MVGYPAGRLRVARCERAGVLVSQRDSSLADRSRVPAFPILKTIKAGTKDVITIPELFATAADYTLRPTPTEVPQPPFAATSYSRGIKNMGTVPIRAMIAIAGVGFPIDWAGTTAPWFTWGRT